MQYCNALLLKETFPNTPTFSSSTTGVQHPPEWCDNSHIALERPPHTSLLVERRQSDEANQCMGMIRRPWWWQRPMGKFGQDAGLHPHSFSKDILGFLMTRETGPQFNISSKGWCFLQYSVPDTIGRPRLQGEPPLLVSLAPLPAAI